MVAARAGDALHSFTPQGRRQRLRERERLRQKLFKVVTRIIGATIAIMLAAGVWGLVIGPLGIMGVVAAMVLMLLTWIAIIKLSSTPPPSPQMLAQSDLPLLPARTDEWLARQRAALPAPAARIVDGISLQLEALAPQLQALDAGTPIAQQFRKLVGEELPELIQGYQRVPQQLRREARNGPAPDKQLLDGLGIVKGELDRMGSQIASGDLDKLATQNRYLELKYRSAEDDQV